MEGRKDTGVLVSLSNCTPGKEAEIEKWYRGEHMHEMLAPKVFTIVNRLENPNAKGDQTSPRFLSLYETSRPNIPESWAEHEKIKKTQKRGGLHPDVTSAHFGIFARNPANPNSFYGKRGPVKKTTGILFSWGNIKPGVSIADHADWFRNYHFPDVLATGMFHTATQYVNTNIIPGKAPFLTIYETDLDDPLTAAPGLSKGTYRMMDRNPTAPSMVSGTYVFKFSSTGKQAPQTVGSEHGRTSVRRHLYWALQLPSPRERGGG